MNAQIRSSIQLSILFACFSLLLPQRAKAQTFTDLHDFDPTSLSDGCGHAGLILSGGTLYGTGNASGQWGYGTVFAISPGGTDLRILHSFTPAAYPDYTNSDGAIPWDRLVLSGDALYGTTTSGGTSGNGVVFVVNTGGTGFTNLHNFSATTGGNSSGTPINSDGTSPYAGLILSSNTLFGTTRFGGDAGWGTVFAINTDGTGFTNLHSFAVGYGGIPDGGLILSGNTLFGARGYGGDAGWGTVFAINTDGTGFTNLHTFAFSDGALPFGGLVLLSNTLYGTTAYGGIEDEGTVFAVNTDGTGFAVLHSFPALGYDASMDANTNGEGANPEGDLILSGNTLYGTASQGGSAGNGTVFAFNTDGTGFTKLHDFAAFTGNTNNEGGQPEAGLILSGNLLFGTASRIGKLRGGTIFSIALEPPQLAITTSGANVILSWPTYAPGVTLQSAASLIPPIVWSTNLPSPVVVNGQNVVTNLITGTQEFFRLIQ
jgi:uncharacterized repeat protein (TIGR03803 family)